MAYLSKNKIVLFILHLLAWSFFLLLPILAIPKLSYLIENDYTFLIVYFVSSIASICFFYFSYYFLIPKYLFKHKYLIFSISCISFIVASIILTRTIISMNFLFDNSANSNQPKLFGNYLLRFLIVFIAAFALRFYQKMKQIKVEQIASELANLKAQINPHFLFNTLNAIYALALTKSDKTADYISKLSSMMRYSLSKTSAEKVLLENEIDYIKNYIALQKIRLTETTHVNFTIQGQIDEQQIPPLLFIDFIENAFKYGVSNEMETEVKIQFVVEENTVSMYVSNEKVNQSSLLPSNEIGLKNIKRRMDLIYQNNYHLKIENSEKKFEVNLMINQI